jgi:hypothetical protein
MLAYCAVAVALTWPVALGLGSVVPGADRTELWTTLWSLDFVANALAEGRVPLETGLLSFPDGGYILVDDPLGALLVAPVTLLGGVNLALTVLVWLQIGFAGVMAHSFAREWLNWRAGRQPQARSGAAWVAGLGFCTAPILLSAVHNGEAAAIGGGWGAWAAWMCWRAAAHGGRRRLELAVAALAMTALGGWTATVTAFCFAAALALVGAGEGLRVHLRTRVLVLVLGLAVVVPLRTVLEQAGSGGQSIRPAPSADQAAALRRGPASAELAGYLLPGDPKRPSVGADDRRVQRHYLGWSLIGLAALGLVRRRRGAGAVLLAGSAGLVLSLGPVLLHGGEPVFLAGKKVVPLPYVWLESLPGLDSITLLYQLAVVPALCVSLLAAAAVAGRKLRWLAIALSLLFVEGQWGSPSAGLPGSTRVMLSPAIEVLAQAPEGAVVNFPVVPGRSYLLEQVHHGKPMSQGLEPGQGEAAQLLWTEILSHQDREPAWIRAKISAAAERLGIRYVLIHVDPDAQPDMHDTAIQTLERAYLPMPQPGFIEPGAPAARVLKLW